jgi:ankyrin repeat protein
MYISAKIRGVQCCGGAKLSVSALGGSNAQIAHPSSFRQTNLGVIDNQGQTALDYAVERGATMKARLAVRLLRRAGATPK